MPFYDVECPRCGVTEDTHVPLQAVLDRTVLCPACAELATVRVNEVRTEGPTTSQPFYVDSIERGFESKREIKEYLAHHNVEMLDANDSVWKRRQDRHREKVEKKAKERGFRDWDDQAAWQKRKRESGQT